MSLLDVIRSGVIGRDTAATHATAATFQNTHLRTVARVANVATRAERVGTHLSFKATVATVTRVEGAAEHHRVDELTHLLKTLLWDAPHEVEPEIERALRNGSLDEALACYRLCHTEYERLGEPELTPNDSQTIYWGVW